MRCNLSADRRTITATGGRQVGTVHCVATLTMSGPPPAQPWPRQGVSLQLQQAETPA
jgi:hypothetical protein